MVIDDSRVVAREVSFPQTSVAHLKPIAARCQSRLPLESDIEVLRVRDARSFRDAVEWQIRFSQQRFHGSQLGAEHFVAG